MRIKTEQDIVKLISEDANMMHIIETANTLQLPDWWICAGFVRSKIWDVLHGFEQSTVIDDVDVVYFDSSHTDEAIEKQHEYELTNLLSTVPWSVKNEARMHFINGIEPYTSTADAISKFPETATALGVKVNEDGDLQLIAPHGIEDVLKLSIRPTPYFEASEERMKIYDNRIRSKNWKEKWNLVTYSENRRI